AALMVRFARSRDGGPFATVLSDSLSASRWLAERIMLDISGQQLATTLKALGMAEDDGCFVLERLYSHLADEQNGASGAQRLWNGLDADTCGRRVEAWRQADGRTNGQIAADAVLNGDKGE